MIAGKVRCSFGKWKAAAPVRETLHSMLTPADADNGFCTIAALHDSGLSDRVGAAFTREGWHATSRSKQIEMRPSSPFGLRRCVLRGAPLCEGWWAVTSRHQLVDAMSWTKSRAKIAPAITL